MKKIMVCIFLIINLVAISNAYAVAIMDTARGRVEPQIPVMNNPQAMSPEAKGRYCQTQGYKLLNCSDPYIAGERCEFDPAFVKECVCKPEYNKACPETQGLKGMGIRCNGLYTKCCTITCSNPYASLTSCKEQGLEEIHSERDYNDCGDICYVCKDICTKGTPERMCPYGQECQPIDGIRSQQGQRCCNCECPEGQKECMGVCIAQNECCPACKDGFKCSEGLCLAQ